MGTIRKLWNAVTVPRIQIKPNKKPTTPLKKPDKTNFPGSGDLTGSAQPSQLSPAQPIAQPSQPSQQAQASQSAQRGAEWAVACPDVLDSLPARSPDPGNLFYYVFFKSFIDFLFGFMGVFGTVTAFHDIFNVFLGFPMDFLTCCFKILVFLWTKTMKTIRKLQNAVTVPKIHIKPNKNKYNIWKPNETNVPGSGNLAGRLWKTSGHATAHSAVAHTKQIHHILDYCMAIYIYNVPARLTY